MDIGQKVQWTSQSRGYQRTKIGKVVRIIKAHKLSRNGFEIPWKVAYKEFPHHQIMFNGSGLPGGKKTEEAYFIEVPADSPKAKPKLYMPFPNKLVKIK